MKTSLFATISGFSLAHARACCICFCESGTSLALSFGATVEDFESCAGLVITGLKYGCCDDDGLAQVFFLLTPPTGDEMSYFACFNFTLSTSDLLMIVGIALAVTCTPILIVAYVVNSLSEMSFRRIFALEAVLLLIGAACNSWILEWSEMYSALMVLGAIISAGLAGANWLYATFSTRSNWKGGAISIRLD